LAFFFAKTCLWLVQGWFPACTLLLEQAVDMGSQGPKEPKEKLEINELTCFFCAPNFTELVLGSRHFFCKNLFMPRPRLVSCMHPAFGTGGQHGEPGAEGIKREA